MTGSTGRCGKGTLEILKLLPIKIVNPDDLKGLVDDAHNPIHRKVIYLAIIENKHLVKHQSNADFTSKDYYTHPD